MLDRSGLQKGKDYVREESFTTDEGRQRPDAVIYLPQNKHLIVDAKVSLNAYTRYVNAEDDLERAQALKSMWRPSPAELRNSPLETITSCPD